MNANTQALQLLTPDYLKLAKSNPHQALQQVGIEPTPEIISAIETMDIEALLQSAQLFCPKSKSIPYGTP